MAGNPISPSALKSTWPAILYNQKRGPWTNFNAVSWHSVWQGLGMKLTYRN
jgi:hypothetical protein